MSRPIIAVFAVLALLQMVFAIDLSTTKDVEVAFADKDIVPKTALKTLLPNSYAAGFIGNLEIGGRYPDETIFRRRVEFNNPTNTVQSSTLTLNVNNGNIHYISVVNESGSYAVVCEKSNTLESSRVNLNIRAAANTKSYLTIVTAVH